MKRHPHAFALLWLALVTGLIATIEISRANSHEYGEVEEIDHKVDPTAPCSAVPPEVTGVEIDQSSTISWANHPCTSRFNIYRGGLAGLLAGHPPRCLVSDLTATSHTETTAPPDLDGFVYLITGEAIEEGTPGSGSTNDAPRALLGSCDGSIRRHTLERVTYGWSEWSADRLDTLGTQGFIDEQLDPATIDESTNNELITRKATIEPPETATELEALALVNAVYARRQLEQRMAVFWSNHFNTFFSKTRGFFNSQYADSARKNLETATVHYVELETFRDEAFNATFRDIVETSSKSPNMIIYLDTRTNKVGSPNENFSRELLELYTMGVAGGYTDMDVVELAKVLTGWNVCKKIPANVDDPLAPCIDPALIDTPDEPDGSWVANFTPGDHDCTLKTVLGTPIGPTCGDNVAMAAELGLALDTIVAHPSTPGFISKKLLVEFVTETPTQPMIDAGRGRVERRGEPRGRRRPARGPAGGARPVRVLGPRLLRPEDQDPLRARRQRLPRRAR